eukprot:gene7497-2725_t
MCLLLIPAIMLVVREDGGTKIFYVVIFVAFHLILLGALASSLYQAIKLSIRACTTGTAEELIR